MTTKLYNGEIELEFNEAKHHYTVNGETIDGVTSILGVISKPALVPWAVKEMANNLTEKMIVGKAYDEIEKKELIAEAKKIYKSKTDKAADIGTIVHQWCEDYIAGKNPEMPVNEQIRKSVEAFKEFVTKNKVEFKLSERKIYSKKYGYAGTLDFTAVIDGKKYIGDFKTSSAVYNEYFLQLAAYKYALEEEYPELKIDKCMIVRLGKDGELEVVEGNDSDKNFEAFLGALNLYRRLKEMKFQTYEK
jgi:hypothetical protein